jgi:hypothetical protein
MRKRPIKLTPAADLSGQCRSEIDNFSAHVDALPSASLAQRQVAADADEVRTERAIDTFSALYHKHGSLSEEMQFL